MTDRSAYLREGYKVGRYGFMAVGIGGTVTAIEKDWIEIEGQRLPRSLAAGLDVRWISTQIPDEPVETFGGSGCADCDETNRNADNAVAHLVDQIRTWHEVNHDDGWVVCIHGLCRTAQEMGR